MSDVSSDTLIVTRHGAPAPAESQHAGFVPPQQPLAETPVAEPVEIATPNLSVRFYERDPHRLVVIFASAGSRRVFGFAEEFRETFWSTGVSLIFVTDRHNQWFNYPEAEDLLEKVAKLTEKFSHIGVFGESLGGSAAILFTNYAKNIDRAIAFTPQYSILPPFVNFDGRYDYIGRAIKAPIFLDYSKTPIKERVTLIYGNTVWRDYLHCCMFQAAGLRVMGIDGAPHEMGSHLKKAYTVNALQQFVKTFTDFEKPLTEAALKATVPVTWTDELMQPAARFPAELRGLASPERKKIAQIDFPAQRWPLLSAGKPALQSSICEWSRGKTVEEDAAGAVNGKISEYYNFHTRFDNLPWWQVDLLAQCQIYEVRLFNRIENPTVAARCHNFKIEISSDGAHWENLIVKDDNTKFGGADGRPYCLVLSTPRTTRYLRVSLLKAGCLHLNQVQIFGLG